MMSSTESLTISSNRTLVSSGGVFELGFFKPSALSRWYLWNGSEFSGIPEVQGLSYMVYDYTENSEEVAYTFLMANQSIYSRLKISELGYLYRFTWIPPSWGWNIFWTLPTDDCDIYESWFDPKNRQQWDLREGSDGCVRRTPLSCSGNGFSLLKNMKLPDTKMAVVDRMIDAKKCKERCLSDCDCTSFAAGDVQNGGLGCVIWTGDLSDIRTYSIGGQDLYVKVAVVDLDMATCIHRYTVAIFHHQQTLMGLKFSSEIWIYEGESGISDVIMLKSIYKKLLKSKTQIKCIEDDRKQFNLTKLLNSILCTSSNKNTTILYKTTTCGAGRNWKKGQGLAIVDMVIKDSSSPTFRPREILRRLQIGLLCVQSRVDDRPLMSAVVLMLESEAVDIPQPNPPGYCVI
uniref:Apple domain-containing protein n=1 Tax=Brassica campestris TaxID=3711 RepID=M4FCE8_BRACM